MMRIFLVVRWLLFLTETNSFSFYNTKWVLCSSLSNKKQYPNYDDNLVNNIKYNHHHHYHHHHHHHHHHHVLNNANTALSSTAIAAGNTMIEAMKMNPKLLSKTSLLVNLWGAISYPMDNIEETDFILHDYQLTRYDVEGLTKHFQACKDCAAEGVFLMATQNDNGHDVLRLTNMPHELLTDDGDDDEWGVYEQDEAVVASEQIDTRPIFPIESDDEVIISDTKNWVQKGMVVDNNNYDHRLHRSSYEHYHYQPIELMTSHGLSMYSVMIYQLSLHYSSIYPFIHLSIHLSINLSIHPSIHLSIYLSTRLSSICPSIIYLPIYLSTRLSSVCSSITYLSTRLSSVCSSITYYSSICK